MSAWGQAGGEDKALDDATVEALLADRYHGDAPDLAPLSRFVRQMRSFADGPAPSPSAALAQVLSDSVPFDLAVRRAASPEHGDRRARRFGRQPEGSPRATAPRPPVVRIPVPVLAAAASAVLVAVLLAAGSARMLPGPTQDLVAQAVRTVTPFDFPEGRRPQATLSTAPSRQTAQPQRAAPVDPSEPGTGDRANDGALSIAPIAPGATDSPARPGGSNPAPAPSTTTTALAPRIAPTVPESNGRVPAVTTTSAPPRSVPPPRLGADLSGVMGTQTVGDPDGKGRAVLGVNPGRDELCLTLVTSGIGPVTAVHVHAGSTGSNGPVVATFEPVAEMSVICVTAPDQLVKRIRKDPRGYYVDVHTGEFPKGALTGQLTKHSR